MCAVYCGNNYVFIPHKGYVSISFCKMHINTLSCLAVLCSWPRKRASPAVWAALNYARRRFGTTDKTGGKPTGQFLSTELQKLLVRFFME